MPFDHALSGRALSDELGRDDLVVIYGDMTAPAATGAGSGQLDGYAVSGDMVAPLPTTSAYVQAIPTEVTFVGELRSSDASGDIAVGYPTGTQYGDFAILVLGWESTAAGTFSAPLGWQLRETETNSTCGQVFTQRVTDTSTFVLEAAGARNGGGYIMHVYRKAELSASEKNNGSTDPVSWTGTTLTTDNWMSLFAVSVGQPNVLSPSDVSAPYSASETIVGDNGIGKATMWSARGQIIGSGAHTPADIEPSWTSIAAHVWASFNVGVKEDPFRHYSLSFDTTAPLPTMQVTVVLTRVGTSAMTAPLPTMAGSGIVYTSGREVCVSDGGANSVAAMPGNQVSVSASANSAVVLNLNNGQC